MVTDWPARPPERPRNGPPLAVRTMRATRAGVVVGPQALVDRAVLAVDRHQLGARRAAGPLHHRSGGDQRLLVGQGQAATGAAAWPG